MLVDVMTVPNDDHNSKGESQDKSEETQETNKKKGSEKKYRHHYLEPAQASEVLKPMMCNKVAR